MTTLDRTKIAPWSDDTPELLTRTLTHIVRAWVVNPDGENVPLDVTDGSISFDETRAPRCQADLVVRLPDDQALLDRIDPRAGARVNIEVGYRRPDGSEDVQPICDLVLRSRRVRRPANTLTLEAMGDESLVIDDSASNGGTITGANTINGITSVVRLIFPGVPFTFGATAGPAVSQTPMGDKWSAVMDLADRIEAQVYDDGLRNWHCSARPVLATPVLEIKVGEDGTIISSDTGLDRDEGFYNRVFLTYQWLDAANVTQKVVSTKSITSGVYAATVGNVRTFAEVRELPATSTEAAAAATTLVKRTVTRGRSFSVEAISAYWLRPGHTVEVSLPIGDPEEHLVTAVSFGLREGTMQVTTRLPDNFGTVG